MYNREHTSFCRKLWAIHHGELWTNSHFQLPIVRANLGGGELPYLPRGSKHDCSQHLWGWKYWCLAPTKAMLNSGSCGWSFQNIPGQNVPRPLGKRLQHHKLSQILVFGGCWSKELSWQLVLLSSPCTGWEYIQLGASTHTRKIYKRGTKSTRKCFAGGQLRAYGISVLCALLFSYSESSVTLSQRRTTA